MLHTENMALVPDEGAVPDKGSYMVRISEVRETDQAGAPLVSDKGEPKVVFVCNILDEGKWLGHKLQIHASLQAHALRTLKAVYKAVGYTPGEEGHDPSKCLDGEFYVTGEPQDYEGKNGPGKSFNIAPWNMKSIQEGPAKLRS